MRLQTQEFPSPYAHQLLPFDHVFVDNGWNDGEGDDVACIHQDVRDLFVLDTREKAESEEVARSDIVADRPAELPFCRTAPLTFPGERGLPACWPHSVQPRWLPSTKQGGPLVIKAQGRYKASHTQSRAGRGGGGGGSLS